jgi:hypothetical protein
MPIKYICLLFCLLGCAKSADSLKAPLILGAETGVAPLENNDFQTAAPEDFQRELASSTFVVYPSDNSLYPGDDLKDWEVSFDQELADLWERVGAVDTVAEQYYRPEFSKNTMSAEKLAKISGLISSMGGIRNRSYLKLKSVQQDIIGIRQTIAEESKALLARYTCYQPQSRGINKICKLKRELLAEGMNEADIQSENSFLPDQCRVLKRMKFPQMTEEEKKSFEEDVTNCEEAGSQFREEEKNLVATSDLLLQRRNDAKGVVVKILEELTRHTAKLYGPERRIPFFFKLQTHEEARPESFISFKKNEAGKWLVEEMQLVGDFGHLSPDLSGENLIYHYPSKENDELAILNPRFSVDRFGATLFHFEVAVPRERFLLEAALAMTISDYGLRFAGDIFVTRPGGPGQNLVKRQGIGLLEMRRK